MNRPYTFINAAMTLDGKIDSLQRNGAAISSAADWERVDALRASSDAIMVGGRTALDEDPRLLVKSAPRRDERQARGLPPNPAKVAILSQANFRPQSRFLHSGPARVILYTTERTPPEQRRQLQAQGAEVYLFGQERVDLPAAMQHLYALGIRRLMVEGGGTLIAALLAANLVDEIFLYLAPLIFGGASAPTLADGPGLPPDRAIRLRLQNVQPMPEDGLLLHYTIPHP